MSRRKTYNTTIKSSLQVTVWHRPSREFTVDDNTFIQIVKMSGRTVH